MRWRLAFPLVLAACGGTDVGRPVEQAPQAALVDPGSGPVSCDAAPGLGVALLEDFELGAAASGWYTNADVCAPCQKLMDRRDALSVALRADPTSVTLLTEKQQLLDQLVTCRAGCEAVEEPNLFDKPLFAERLVESRCGSRYALHVVTAKLTDWGGNVGAELRPPMDASGYDGLSFWARVAPASRTTLRVELSDRNTDPTYVGNDGQPPCNPDTTPDTLETGCDHFGISVVLNGDWQHFLVRFDELRQAGWGKRAPALELAALTALSFTWGTGAWNVWIDDVGFYTR